eukprot:TRINITY_DN5135_c0_g1_i1.p1 TRINITY_DN5135_c0_g1~~TRINITY_DN5135_c0_g1_i1.p1  ORF type:complete len:629 (-),score=176.59 TRINITY_DN5135_c0_g1_i1:47-1933(-)
MIEHITIFTKSGFVLWSYSYATLSGNPVNELINQVLMEERNQDSFSDSSYTMKWNQANEYELFFAVVYSKTFQSFLLYIDELLNVVKDNFCDTFKNQLKDSAKAFTHTYKYDEKFEKLFRQIQAEFQEKKNAKKEVHKPRSFEETAAGKKIMEQQVQRGKDPKKKKKADNKEEEEASEDESQESSPQASPAGSPDTSPKTSPSKLDEIEEKKRKFIEKQQKLNNKSPSKKQPVEQDTTPTKKPKKRQNWNNSTPEEIDGLDFSKRGDQPTDAPSEQAVDHASMFGVGEKIDLDGFVESDSEDEEEEDSAPSNKQKPAKKGGLLQFFKNFTNKELTDAELEPVLSQVRDHLISKNVAQEVATSICDSVKQNLVGKQLGTFDRVSTAVKQAMEDALTRILTPKRNIDILRDSRALNDAKKGPYVIVFVGVNGVGKSTSLSKVCSWLQQNDMRVLIAACDTFRSGAVEQLLVHSRNLEAPVYHQGYGKDAANIAHAAITKARREGFDVVLVDTAGRMQDNEPLMRALAKLVGMNNPNLVIFVGEALVGNESVDQLQKFNRALEEFGAGSNPRTIDGIFLTKFDTVDEKVGAAISMVYTTGQPILFVGMGQKYSDLKALNVKRIVSILLKGN